MRSEIFSMPQAGVNRRVTTCLVERDWNGGDIHWRINRNAREKLGGRCALPSGFSPFGSRGSGAVDAVDPPVQLVGFDVLSAQDANPVLLVKQQEVDGRDRTDVFSIFKWYDARVFRTFAAHVRRESTKECGNARATNEFFNASSLPFFRLESSRQVSVGPIVALADNLIGVVVSNHSMRALHLVSVCALRVLGMRTS